MRNTRLLWITVLALAGGCEKPFDHHHDDDGAGDDDGAENEDEGVAVDGSVSRDPAAAPFGDNDAKGTVFVAMFADACGGMQVVANTSIPHADLSAAGSVAFSLEPVGPGHYFITAFLDDNGDYDPAAPGPDKGDIVMAMGAGASCVEVDVADADVDGVTAVLNLALPFDPPTG